MPIDDAVDYTDDDSNEAAASSLSGSKPAPSPFVGEQQNDAPTLTPLSYTGEPYEIQDVLDDDEEDDWDDDLDDYEREPTGGVVDVVICVGNPVEESPLPAIGKDALMKALGNVFGGETYLRISEEESHDDGWVIRVNVDRDSPQFMMTPQLMSASSTMINPRMVEGELTGDLVDVVASGRFTY